MWRRNACALACALAAGSAGAAGGAGTAAGSISPAGDSVPENLLRIELAFDRPVDAPLDMRRVHLLDAEGRPIADAFLDQALPASDGRSITILMHPGRIKSTLGPNLALGPALRAGSSVTLVVDHAGLGRPLVKQWHVTEAVHGPLQPAEWKLELPRAGSKAPLSVTLPSAMNTSAAQLIAVAAPDGARAAGKASLAADGGQWRFTPASAWRPGSYQLRLHPAIEDAAGNRLCAGFEQVRQSRLQCDDEAVIGFAIAAGRRQYTSRQ